MKAFFGTKIGKVLRGIGRSAAILGVSVFTSLAANASERFPTDTFDIPEGAYKATFVEDRDHVSVMTFSGNYDKLLEGGQFNRAARATVAQEFFRTHPDNYDFIVTFTAFEFETGSAHAFYHGVQNDTRGIGLPLFDNTDLYGSNGKLQGFVDMAAMYRNRYNPYDSSFEQTLSILAHEVLHRWGSYVDFTDAEGNPSNALRGPQDSHWSFFLNSEASVQYGHKWRDNGDGTFTAVATGRFYSPLDLYLMGLYGPQQVPDFYLIDATDGIYSSTHFPLKGAKITGTKQFVTVNDIIAAEGPRVPGVEHSQKEFRFAFIYLVGPDQDVNSAEMQKINTLRKAFVERFSIMTGGRGIAHVYPEAMPVAELGEQTGVSADEDDVIRVEEADVADALAWLRSEQDTTYGYWQDKTNTRLRDTSVVYQTLRELDPSFVDNGKVVGWLASHEAANTDSLARRLLALGVNTELGNILAGRQAANGGWGLLPSYNSNALDTALAVRALAKTSLAPDNVYAGVQYLLQHQNADYGWAEADKGASGVRATTAAIRALVAASDNSAAIENALAWLTTRQNADGGFGRDQSTVHETAEVLLVLVESQKESDIDTIAALAFIKERQRTSGNWEGSVYTTAIAAQALRSVSLPNLTLSAFSPDKFNKQDGERVTLTLKVSNDSPLDTAATELQLYEGNPQSGGVAILSPATVPALTPGNSLSFEFIWDTFGKAGEQTLYAVVDPGNTLNERTRIDNTRSLDYTVPEAPAGIDLELNNSEFLISPANLSTLPVQLSASAILRNLGQTAANNIVVQLWYGRPEAGGTQVEQQVVDIDGRSSRAVNFVMDLTSPGSSEYLVIADPDNLIEESKEDNNRSAKTITTTPTLDLEITAQDITHTPEPAALFEDVSFQVTLRNRGTLASPNVPVLFGVQNGNGFQAIENTQISFAAGEAKTVTVVWRANLVGNSTFVVAIDENNLIAETNESNNNASIVVTTQQLAGSNLAIASKDLTFTPNPAREGFGVTLSATVFNTGTTTLTSVPVAFYDGDPATDGTRIEQTLTIPEIAPAQSVTVNRIWPELSDSADRNIFVVVDPENVFAELNESDNRAFDKLVVESLPDLAISEAGIQLSPKFPKIGDTATLTITVSNRGNQAAENVLLRAYRGEPGAGGVEIDNGYTIPIISTFGSADVSIEIDFPQQGVEEIYVVVNPDRAIRETTLSNNQALKRIAIQDGSFYVSERYISPGNDQIKDSTDYFFRLENADTVTVVVLDHRGRELRHFDNAFVDVLAGSITWDGRTDQGGVVLDGDYRLAVKNSNGDYIGVTNVTVDTNRSSLIEALNTQYELTRNLTCSMGKVSEHGDRHIYVNPFGDQDTLYSPDNESIFFKTYFEPVGEPDNLQVTDEFTLYPTGLYRAKADGAGAKHLLSELQLDVKNIYKMYVTDDGARLVVLVRELPGIAESYQIWDMNANDGSNLRKVFEASGSPLEYDYQYGYFLPGTHTFVVASYAGSARNLRIDRWDLGDGGAIEATPLIQLDNVIDNPVSPAVAVKLEANITGTHLAIWVASENVGTGQDYASYFAEEEYRLYLLNLNTGASIALSNKASAFAWSPDGGSIAVGDTTRGAVVLFDSSGNTLQTFALGKQYTLTEENEYIAAALPAEYRSPESVLGRFGGISWNPDGSEFSFVFEDIATGFIIDQLINAAGGGVDEHGYGTSATLDDIDLNPFRLNSRKGVYVADIRENSLQKAADIPHLERYFSYDPFNDLGPDDFSVDEELTEQDEYGTYITSAGLPYVPWVKSPRDRSWQKNIRWMPGSRAVLLSMHKGEGFVVGFDSATATRELFGSRNIDGSRPLLATSSGRYLHMFSDDEADACVNNGETQGYRQVQSLLNLVADLRAIRSVKAGGILLQGTATDRNFESYSLEFAPVGNPENWQLIEPASDVSLIDSQFTTWVPPDEGSYYIRLTVNDIAGNQRRVVVRASISERPGITGLYRSPSHFSPNSDGVKDVVKMHFKVLEPVNLELNIYNDSGTLVRSYSRSYSDIGSEHELVWDGRDNSGQKVPDGIYKMVIQNYEFFVTVDTEFPVIEDNTPELLQFRVNRDGETLLFLDDSLEFKAFDTQSIPSVKLEYLGNQGPGWASIDIHVDERNGEFIFPAGAFREEGARDINEWINGEFRIRAEDAAGNTSVHVIPGELKRNQAYITNIGFDAGPMEAEPDGLVAVRSDSMEYEKPLNFIDNTIYRLASDETIYLDIVESVASSVENIEILYAEHGSQNFTSVSNVEFLDVTGPCPVNKERGVVCFERKGAGLENRTDTSFSLSWNLAPLPLEAGKIYRTYLRLTDSGNNIVVTNSFRFATNFVGTIFPSIVHASIGCVDEDESPNCVAEEELDQRQERIPAVKLVGKPLHGSGYNRVDLFLKSQNDKRFIQPVLLDTVYSGSSRSVFDAFEKSTTFYFDARKLQPCEIYDAEALFTLTDGSIVKSASQPVSTACLDIITRARPVFPDSCDAPATNRVLLEMQIDSFGTPIERPQLQELRLYRELEGQATPDIFFNVNAPEYLEVYSYELDSEAFAEGELRLFARVVDVAGHETKQEVTIPIVHTAPAHELTFPLNGEKYCATAYLNLKGEVVRGLAVRGESRSKGQHTLELYTQARASSLDGTWDCEPIYYNMLLGEGLQEPPSDAPLCPLKPQLWPLGSSNVVNSKALMITNNETGESHIKGTLGYLKFSRSGLNAIEFQTFNWSGARTCERLTIEVDATVDGLSITPIQGATGKFRHVPVYSPNADGIFDEIGWNYAIEENVSLWIDVASVEHTGFDEFKNPQFVEIAPVENLASALEVLPGARQFTWDASAAADGFYRVTFKTVDTCGLEAVRERLLEIDNTPPAVAITAPATADALGIVVEPRGTVTDAQGVSYVLSFGRNADEMVSLASRDRGVSIVDEKLGQWNTFGIEGNWLLRLVATDSVGNTAEVIQPVTLPVREALISLLEPTEDFISPNGDGELDTAIFRVGFEQDIIASVEIVQGGNLVESLASNAAYSAGVSNLAWDGLDASGNPYADANYQIRVTAQPAAGGGNIQVEQASIELDNTPPAITVNNLIDGVLGIQGVSAHPNIPGAVADAHFREYSVILTATPSGSVWLPLASDTTAPAAILTDLAGDEMSENGIYKVRIQALDLAANSRVLEFDLLIDTKAPEVRIDSPVEGTVVKSADASLAVAGGIVEPNLAGYSVRLIQEGSTEPPVIERMFNELPVDNLLADLGLTDVNEGNYRLEVTAVDKGGLEGSHSVTLAVDNTVPTATITAPGANGFISGPIQITGTANDDHFQQFELALAGGDSPSSESFSPLILSNNPITNGSLFSWQTLPQDGVYTLRLTVVDLAGNQTQALRTVTIDTRPPAAPTLEALALDRELLAVTLTWSAVDDADLKGYIVYRNGTRLFNDPITKLTFNNTAIAEGAYTYQVAAVDAAGLEGRSETRQMTVDFTPPNVQISRPADNNVVSGLVSIYGTAFSTADFKEYRVFAGADENTLSQIHHSSISISGGELAQWDTLSLPEGTSYLVRLQAEDINGNSAHDDVVVAIDNTPPEAPTGLAATPASSDVALSWNPSPEPDVLGYLLLRNDKIVNASGTVVGDLAPYALTASHYTDAGLVDGTHIYVVLAMDRAGNISEPSAPVEVPLDNHPPHVEFVGLEPDQAFENSLFIAVESEDEDIAEVAFEYRPANTVNWLLLAVDTAEPFNFQWDSAAIVYGAYELRATAKDNAAKVDPAASVLPVNKLDLTRPDAVPAPVVSVTGSLVNLTWADSEAADLAGYNVHRKPSDSTEWELLTGTPVAVSEYADLNVEDGHYDYRIVVADLAGNLSDPSASAYAIVFTPEIVRPFSPTPEAQLPMSGKTLPYASVTLEVFFNDALVSSTHVVAEQSGAFAFEPVAIEQGRSHYTLTTMNPDGFTGNSVTGSLKHAELPAQVTGVMAGLSADNSQVELTWNVNPEPGIAGYRLYRDDESVSPLVDERNMTASSPAPASSSFPVSAVTDRSSGTYWAPDESVTHLDLVLEQPAWVDQVTLEWVSMPYVASEYEVLAWDGEQYVVVSHQEPEEPLQLQEVKFARPYFTDNIRVNFLSAFADWAFRPLRLGEAYVKSIGLSDTEDFFTDQPTDGFHRYSVSAVNNSGFEGPEAAPREVAFGDVVAPEAVTLTAEAIGSDVVLNWTASVSPDVASYRVYRDGGLIAEQSRAEGLSYTDMGLANGSYIYRVRPIDQVNNAGELSNQALAVVAKAVLPAPVNLMVTPDGNQGDLILEWEPAPGSTPAGYYVYRAHSADGVFERLADTAAPAYRDSDTVIGTTYYYHVRSLDDLNNPSAPSPTAQGTAEDSVAPVMPVIYSPAVAGAPVSTLAETTDIVGFADPGTTVYLLRNNLVEKQTVLPAQIPNAVIAGDRVGDIATSETGELAAIMRSPAGVYGVYLLRDHGWVLLGDSDSLEMSINAIAWAGSKLMITDQWSKLGFVDAGTGAVEVFDNLFPQWGSIDKLVGYDNARKIVTFIGYDHQGEGVFEFNTESESMSLVYADSDYQTSSLSPDGNLLAYVRNVNSTRRNLFILNLNTFETRMIEVAGGNASAFEEAVGWSSDSARVLVTTGNSSSLDQINIVDIDTEEVTVVASDTTRHFSRAVWSTDNNAITFEARGSGNTQLIKQELDSGNREVLFDTGTANRLDWITWSFRNVIAFGQSATGLVAVRLPGQFIFPDVELAVGENHFSALSVDAAGNESPAAAAVQVARNLPDRADLMVSIATQPLLPQVNTGVSVLLSVRNNGSAASMATTLALSSRVEGGVVTTLMTGGEVPALEAGGSVTLPVDWVATETGATDLIAIVDPDNTQAESDKGNNTGIHTVAVVEVAQPYLDLAVNPAAAGGLAFGAQEMLSGSASLVNAGTVFSGKVSVVVEDMEGYPVTVLATRNADRIAHGSTVTIPFSWNTGVTFAGRYRIKAALETVSGTVLDVETVAIELREDIRLVAGVVTDLSSYGANAGVRIGGTLANTGGNAIFNGGTVRLVIRDSTGNTVFESSQAVGQIIPGDQSNVVFGWNTGRELPGIYTVTLALDNAQSSEILASHANFEIRQGAPQIGGQLTPASEQFGKGEPVETGYTLINSGNSALENVDVTLQVLDPATGVVLKSAAVSTALAYGASLSLEGALDSQGLDLGNYHLALMYGVAIPGGVYEAQLDRKNIAIVDTVAPEVVLTSPAANGIVNSETGSVLVEALDADTAVTAVHLTFNDGNAQSLLRDGTSATRYRKTLAELADGLHSATVTATDVAGNTSNPVIVDFTLDNTAPQIVVSGIIDGEYYAEDVVPVVTVTDPHLSNTEIRLNNEAFASGTTLSDDDDYRLVVTAEDAAGNVENRIVLFGIDKTAAAITIEGVSDGAAYNTPVIPVVTITDANLVSSQTTLNEEAFISGSEITAEGNHVLRVTATDIVGRVSERIVAFELDFTPPDAPLISSPANNASVSNPVVDVVGTTEANMMVTLQTGGAMFNVTADDAGNFIFAQVPLVAADNNLSVTAQDRAGNLSTPTVIHVSVAAGSDVIVEPGLSKAARVLIWAAERDHFYHPHCRTKHHSGHRSDYGYYGRDIEALLELVTDAYTESGTGYFVARSSWEFLKALRSQEYNVIHLLNLHEHHSTPLFFQGKIAIEMRAAVLSGTGLVVMNTKPGSLWGLSELLGAKVTGRVHSTAEIRLNDDIISGNFIWGVSDHALKFDVNGGMPVGTMTYHCGWRSNGLCEQPALVINKYGEGDTALVPFNLVEVENTGEARRFISNLAAFAAPDNVEALPSSLFHVSLGISGHEGGVNLVVDQQLSEGLEYSKAFAGSVLENDNARWDIVTDGEEPISLGAMLFSSEEAGSHSVKSEIYEAIIAPGSLLSEQVLTLEVDKSLNEREAGLIWAIQNLSVNARKRHLRDFALVVVRLATQIPLDRGSRVEKAIFLLSIAIDDLRRIDDREVLVKASKLLRSYQSVWSVKYSGG